MRINPITGHCSRHQAFRFKPDTFAMYFTSSFVVGHSTFHSSEGGFPLQSFPQSYLSKKDHQILNGQFQNIRGDGKGYRYHKSKTLGPATCILEPASFSKKLAIIVSRPHRRTLVHQISRILRSNSRKLQIFTRDSSNHLIQLPIFGRLFTELTGYDDLLQLAERLH